MIRFATVGKALPGTGVRIAADGEVLLSGPNVFAGYFCDEAATEDVENTNGQFARIDHFAILDHDFSLGAGELTPTLKKIKRAVVYDRYHDMYEALYA